MSVNIKAFINNFCETKRDNMRAVECRLDLNKFDLAESRLLYEIENYSDRQDSR